MISSLPNRFSYKNAVREKAGELNGSEGQRSEG